MRPNARIFRRAFALGLVAAASATAVVAEPVESAGRSVVRAAAAAWQSALGERPEAAAGQRVIVVLEAPSLADRLAAAEGEPTAEDQKRWAAEAQAAQRLLLARLAARGVEIRRDRSFSRTVNGFSARLDARAQAVLERTQGITGVYPVRTVYPASITATALMRPEFRPGAGRRPEAGLPGFDGDGLRIALLDSGVELDHPYLNGRVLPGIDFVGRDRRAAAESKPDDPTRVESHGTLMAGLLVGSGGPAGLQGVAPGARVFPIRVLGWQRAADGSHTLLGSSDTLVAGLERAVDPDGDGDVEDAATVTLAAVVAPFASFPDSPEARAVAGATRLGTLVVAPAGNDGRGGRGFGTVGAPAGAPAALAVGALDVRREVLTAEASVTVGGDEALAERVRVVGALPPRGALPLATLTGPSLAEPARPADALANGRELADFFDPNGVSRVAGRAVALATDGAELATKVRNAAAAGAVAVVLYGDPPPAGSLDLDETTAIPVVAVSAEVGRTAVAGLVANLPAAIEFARVRRVANGAAGAVAPFSSGGVAFGGHVKPDLVAPGVGLATADGGTNPDGTPRYATATGSSVAAAVVAGAAATVAQARPGLTAGELRSLLVGSARQIVRDGVPDPVTVQGAGVVDAAGAAAAEVAVQPVTLAFGRADPRGWQVTQTITVRSLAIGRLEVGFGITRDRWREPELSFAASPSRLSLAPGDSADVTLVASGAGPLRGEAGGAFVVAPEASQPVRVPWAVSFRSEAPALLSAASLSDGEIKPSDAAPAVLTFRVGRVASGDGGHSLEAVQLLVAELWTASGKPLGVLTRLHDLLPGRYAFGITGRGPRGRTLAPGRYELRLRAHPVAGDMGAAPTTVAVPFTIVG
jgi:minor extracellular serine protease Vpr